jgi:parallel beta-helix repeat protein
MLHRKLFTAVFLYVYLAISTQISYAVNKSLYVISSQSYSIVKPFSIDANHITLQSTAVLKQEGQGAIALAVWPQKELLFATYDFDNAPAVITWSSTKSLVNIGEFNTGVTGNGLAGIVVDVAKEKIYVVRRQTSYLRVYKWNNAQQTLELNGEYNLYPYPAIYGLALDANGSRLYVSDGTATIHYYDVNNNFAYLNSFNITVGGEQRNAVGIAVDPSPGRGYLYSGGYPDSYSTNTYLVRTKLSDHSSIETPNLGVNVIGISVDVATGYIYCTTTGNNILAYDCNLTLINNSNQNIGSSSHENNPGPAVLAVGSLGSAGGGDGGGCYFEPPVVRNITKEVNYPAIQPAIDAPNTTDGDTLVASEGFYYENPNFGIKKINLRSTDPNYPNRTIIHAAEDYPPVITVANDSTIKGFTIIGGSGSLDDGYNDSEGVVSNDGNLTIEHCRIVSPDTSGSYGIKCSNYSDYILRINHCWIESYKRGILCTHATATITNTSITNNSLYGIYADATNITVDRCDIADNCKFNGYHSIEIRNSSAVIRNNIIHNNKKDGIYLYYVQSTEIRNNTIVGNSGYGIIRGSSADPDIRNNIIRNTSGDLNSGLFTKVNYNCLPTNSSYLNNNTTNISSDPCFRNESANDYHLKSVSRCIDRGDSSFIPSTEKDIDGENRIMDGDINGTVLVDIGADEFKIVDFLSFSMFANAWRTDPNNPKWNAAWDFVADNIIDTKDLAVFVNKWLLPSDWSNGGEGAYFGDNSMMSMPPEEQSLTENIFDSNEQMTESQQDESQQQSEQQLFMTDYNLPAIYLTCDNNTPEPNDEVTIQIHSVAPLLDMGIGIYVVGDANITTAMNEADCNSFGWDNGWNSDPYIDPNGWAYIGSVKWNADANGVIGYAKFRYHSGQVSVYFDQEWSEAFSFDWESQSGGYVPFSQETLLISRDPNDP